MTHLPLALRIILWVLSLVWYIVSIYPTAWMARRRGRDPLWFVVGGMLGLGWFPFLYLWLTPYVAQFSGAVVRRYSGQPATRQPKPGPSLTRLNPYDELTAIHGGAGQAHLA